MDVKFGPLTRDWTKKLKIHYANEANGMVVFMKEALKNRLGRFEDQEKASKCC